MSNKRKYEHQDDSDGEEAQAHNAAAMAGRRRSYYSYMMIFLLLFTTLDIFYFPQGGNKTFEVPRTRINFEERIVGQLTKKEFRAAYRMDVKSFYKLHTILKPQLEAVCFPLGGGSRNPEGNNYLIDTKLGLSMALWFFAGGSVHDIKLLHGVSIKSVYRSIWAVVDATNRTDLLKFHFPNHSEQRRIAAGFRTLSGAGFDKVIGAIDGLLIWMQKPSRAFCQMVNCGEANWRCHRKDKYGFNLQAICDHKLKFIWIDMQWTGATSDYMAWVTSNLCSALENNAVTKIILPGYTLIGDNAYVKKPYMSVPLKGYQTGYNDAYNFYHSQLRINIERAFGAYVHRWAILRSPLVIPTQKVAPLILCLCRLHNS